MPSSVNAYRYELLKQSVVIWADGRGDMIIEQNMRNVDTANWADHTWGFNWSGGSYSGIRAWDDQGPLNVTTTYNDSAVFVKTQFRSTVQPGQNYRYFVAITISNMAEGSGNAWNTHWYTTPGEGVTTYIQAVTFPANSTLTQIAPTPTNQNQNYVEWQQNNTTAGWYLEVDVDYTLSDTIAVPLYKQTSQPWSDDPYGNYPANDTVNTVAKWGCFMTSAAMIIDYWGQRSSPQFRTDPGKYNEWMRNNNGYDASNGVIHSKVVEYAKANGVQLANTGRLSGSSDANNAQVDEYLRTGNPVILGVPGHFVVATGRTTVNGQATYFINDPIEGQTTLYEKYNNRYQSVLLLSGTPADQRNIRISGHSPIELVVTDGLGRKTGYDPRTNTTWSEIPNATYMIDKIAAFGDLSSGQFIESKNLLIFSPLEDQYEIDVIGTGQGSYEVAVNASNWNGSVSQTTSSGTTTSGEVDTIPVDYNSTIGVVANSLYLPSISKAQSNVNVIQNGDFEQGAGNAWQESSTQGWALIMQANDLPIPTHGGNWSAWLGGDNNEIATISQQVQVPTQQTTLRYYAWSKSSDICGYDFGRVLVNETVVELFDLCTDTDSNGWSLHTVGLSQYAGQTIALRFRVETDISNGSSLFVDDMTLGSSQLSMNQASVPEWSFDSVMMKNRQSQNQVEQSDHAKRKR